jgi:hypothetical protein
MSLSTRTSLLATAALTAAAIATAAPVSAHNRNDSPGYGLRTAPPCTALHARYFNVTIDETGAGNISVDDIGQTSCNESVVLWSFASSSAVIDNNEPIIDDDVIMIADLEAAGSEGIDFDLELDPCWAGFKVLRDGDTNVHQEMLGDGCNMVVDVDFSAAPSEAEIHVVQQTGVIRPPHIFTVNGDTTTELTGLPSGTWYVKVYDGFTMGSSISTVGGAQTPSNTLHAVPHDSHVDVDIVTSFWLAPAP